MISFMCAIKKKKQENKTPKLTDTGEKRERAQKDKNFTEQMSQGCNMQYGDSS